METEEPRPSNWTCTRALLGETSLHVVYHYRYSMHNQGQGGGQRQATRYDGRVYSVSLYNARRATQRTTWTPSPAITSISRRDAQSSIRR